MPERMKPSEVLQDPNFRKLSLDEEATLAKAYRQELLAGLRGDLSSLAMIPSLLSPTDLTTIQEDKEALVVEIGGTHFYGARITVKDGVPQVKKSQRVERVGSKFSSAESFFEVLTKELADILEGNSPDALGIIFAFAADAIPTGTGVDLVAQGKNVLGKEVEIPGIGDAPIGEMLRKALSEKLDLSPEIPLVATNDTVAIELAGGANMGAAVATGFNLAYNTDKGIINTESARFDKIPLHRLAIKVDLESQKPGNALAERQISGLYLGRQFAIATRNDESSAVTISETLEKGSGDVFEIAKILRDRSAQLVGVMVGAMITASPEMMLEEQIAVPVEGSLFWKMPGYASEVTQVATRIANKRITFKNIPDAGRIGAGVAALSLLAQK